MSREKTVVRDLTVERAAANDMANHEPGDIVSIRAEVDRKVGHRNPIRRRRTFTFEMDDDGETALLRSFEPTKPEFNHSVDAMSLKHIVPMIQRASDHVEASIPEVRRVRTIEASITDARPQEGDSE